MRSILYNYIRRHKGTVKQSSEHLAGRLFVATGRTYAPETIRRAAYGQRVSVQLALDLVSVLDLVLEDIRPDLFRKKGNK